jgi:hypothetical protein
VNKPLKGKVVVIMEDGEQLATPEEMLAAGFRQGNVDYLAMMEDEVLLHLQKSAGYSGHSPDVWINFRNVAELGITPEMGIYVRMMDKFERLKSLIQNPDNDQVNEPIDDLLKDIGAYTRIARVMRAERNREATPGNQLFRVVPPWTEGTKTPEPEPSFQANFQDPEVPQSRLCRVLGNFPNGEYEPWKHGVTYDTNSDSITWCARLIGHVDEHQGVDRRTGHLLAWPKNDWMGTPHG